MDPWVRIGISAAGAYLAASQIPVAAVGGSSSGLWLVAGLIGLGLYLALPVLVGSQSHIGSTRKQLRGLEYIDEVGSDCGCGS